MSELGRPLYPLNSIRPGTPAKMKFLTRIRVPVFCIPGVISDRPEMHDFGTGMRPHDADLPLRRRFSRHCEPARKASCEAAGFLEDVRGWGAGPGRELLGHGLLDSASPRFGLRLARGHTAPHRRVTSSPTAPRAAGSCVAGLRDRAGDPQLGVGAAAQSTISSGSGPACSAASWSRARIAWTSLATAAAVPVDELAPVRVDRAGDLVQDGDLRAVAR